VLDRKLKYIIILALLLISGILHAKPDIEIVKQRVLAEILRESVDDEEISALIHSMGEDGSPINRDPLRFITTGSFVDS